MGIIEAIAAETERGTTDGPPLQDFVDVDALDTVLTDGPDEGGDSVVITFTYDAMRITASSDGMVLIER